MRYRLLATVSVAVLVIAGALPEALAYLKAGPPMAGPGHHRLKTTNGAPPLDGLASAAVAYSFRKLKTTYSGPGIRLRRASDNAEQDISFLGHIPGLGAPLDVATAMSYCASTSCFVAKWYNQSGVAGRDALRLLSQQPTLVFGCAPNGSPCIRATPAGQLLGTDVPHVAPVMPTTFGTVANRSTGSGQCYWPVQYTANNSVSGGAVGQWVLTGGAGGTITAAAADTVWHAAVGVLAGASSVLRIDAAETAGTATGSTTADAFIPIWSATATDCDVGEVIVWSGYALTPAERAALTANQKSHWGF